MRLYLVRHGQTAWNAEERAQGHTDIPLDDTGRSQARCLASSFLDRAVDLVLTSDLSRSLDTARAVADATGAALESTALLRERRFGEWEGLQYREFTRRLDEMRTGNDLDSVYELCPPGGESLSEAWDRIQPVTERLRREDRRTVVVGHGGVCALMLAQLLQGTLETSRGFRFLNCALTELSRRADGSFQLLRYNDASHLSEPDPSPHAAAR